MCDDSDEADDDTVEQGNTVETRAQLQIMLIALIERLLERIAELQAQL